MKHSVAHSAMQPQPNFGGYPNPRSYQGLHDYLVGELEALLRAEDDGFVTTDTDEYEDRIAGLTFALQSISKLVDVNGQTLHTPAPNAAPHPTIKN